METLRAAIDTGLINDPTIDAGAAVEATMQDARRQLQRQKEGIMTASRMRISEARDDAADTDRVLDEWKDNVRKPKSSS